MSLAKLYVLRIIQIEVYLNFLQYMLQFSKARNELLVQQDKLFEERKQIRKFLNMIELWRLENV